MDSFLLQDITGSINYKMRWGEFAIRLLEGQDGSATKAVDALPRADLDLHAAWKISWDQAKQIGRNRRIGATSDMRTRTLRFNDVFRDEVGCVQNFVVGPDSRVQLLWAALASIFIVWDMVTIPLQLFPLNQAFEQILSTLTYISFTYWVLDVPLHLIFGIQVGGAIEMRPRKLAKIYLHSWLLVDLVVILVDLSVIVLNALQASTNPLYRSGRFLRILRMVRLVRLLRVAKLEREFMLVANYFFSAYTMMALKLGLLAKFLPGLDAGDQPPDRMLLVICPPVFLRRPLEHKIRAKSKCPEL
ncbi:Kcnh7 [Symbiodinium natans]|uniref:Kcnh7 protein n=1 Tax=Symbiodinium natans TaxID=878477 RepID=A0A812QTD0_9DINO|nr:Kcnh7 [Symbiodinium natans]